ncbi:helix-turn-helix domain-containing protein [Flavobacterium sp.]|uniref:helix-turn-helix domain-containing protein n=1 Tax=Flavobacterium sp. TaxID=239 RepID=UPI00261A6A0E|nr:helix-turn-helix domain-containing protein [Flavobacterium sp.]MDD2984807.1 helix-turn-helix domain-containing protein [Flavobacterium sp.]
MINRIFLPVLELAEIVQCYWYSETIKNESVIHEYSTPLLQGMAFNFSNLRDTVNYDNVQLSLYKTGYIYGQPLSPRLFTTDPKGIAIYGVKLKPTAISRLTGISMKHIANKFICMTDIWPNEMESLYDEMQSSLSVDQTINVLERFLLKKMRARAQKNNNLKMVENALVTMHSKNGNIKINTLENKIHTSKKSLHRAFTSHIGIGPKLYSQIIRHNKAKIMVQNALDIDTISIVSELGYFDQSHFLSEFKRFSGMTPTVYHTNLKRDVNKFRIPVI